MAKLLKSLYSIRKEIFSFYTIYLVVHSPSKVAMKLAISKTDKSAGSIGSEFDGGKVITL